MGNARFDTTAYAAYASATTLRADGSRMSTNEIFTQRGIHESLDPKKILFRESRDSEANPNSRPIILGLDVTGSMGMIANEIANRELGNLMNDLIDKQTVADPHIMFMGIGDAYCDRAPLQVSQFEADIRIAEQLSLMYIEGGGGGNSFESYHIPWYFALNHTKIDSFEKRGVKGLLFTIGDEYPPDTLTVQEIAKTFGVSQASEINIRDLYKNVSEKWDVFHLIVEQGSFARGRTREVYNRWYNVIKNRAIRLTDYTKLSTVIRAVIEVNEGKLPEDVINDDPENRNVLVPALYGFTNQE